jgi:hypothetical protein
MAPSTITATRATADPAYASPHSLTRVGDSISATTAVVNCTIATTRRIEAPANTAMSIAIIAR